MLCNQIEEYHNQITSYVIKHAGRNTHELFKSAVRILDITLDRVIVKVILSQLEL